MPDILGRFQLRKDTSTRWASFNPVLREGEVGYETDTKTFRIGDGVTAFTGLSVFTSLPGLTASPANLNVLTGIAGTSGQGNKAVRVKSDGTGLEYATGAELMQGLGISGVGRTAAETITNLNTHTIGGIFYAASTATGLPLAEASIIDHRAGDTTNSAVQEVISIATGRRHLRVRLSGTWGSWREIGGTGGITAAMLASAALRLLSSGFSSPTDAQIPTAAWAKGYADSLPRLSSNSLTDKTATRAMGTNYQNTTGAWLPVSVRASNNGISISAGATAGAQDILTSSNIVNNAVMALIPPGWWYSASGSVLLAWLEG